MPKFSADAFNKAVDHDDDVYDDDVYEEEEEEAPKKKGFFDRLNAIERTTPVTTLKTMMLSMMVTTMMTMTILKMTWNQKMGRLRKLFSGSQGSL